MHMNVYQFQDFVKGSTLYVTKLYGLWDNQTHELKTDSQVISYCVPLICPLPEEFGTSFSLHYPCCKS